MKGAHFALAFVLCLAGCGDGTSTAEADLTDPGFYLEPHDPPEKYRGRGHSEEFYLEPHVVPTYKHRYGGHHDHGYVHRPAPRLVIKERPLYRVHPSTSIRVCSGYINGPCR